MGRHADVVLEQINRYRELLLTCLNDVDIEHDAGGHRHGTSACLSKKILGGADLTKTSRSGFLGGRRQCERRLEPEQYGSILSIGPDHARALTARLSRFVEYSHDCWPHD